MAKASAGKSTKVSVDFSETEGRKGKKGSGRSAHVPEGDYLVKCVKSEVTKSADKETPEIKATYKIAKGKQKGKTLIDDLYLTEKALWRLRVTLEGMGIKVPSKAVKIDPQSLVGKMLGVTVEDDEYDGKVRSRITDAFLPSEMDEESEDLDDDEDDEEEDDEDEEDDDDDDDEIDI